MTALLSGVFLFRFGEAYQLRLASYGHETACNCLHILGHQFLGLLFNYSGCGMYSEATPRLLNSWNCESISLTILSFIYLALKTKSVQPKTLLCIYIPFRCPAT